MQWVKWVKSFFSLFVDAGIKFTKDNCRRSAASLSYYTVFSLAPLLIIIVAVLGLWYEGSAHDELVDKVTEIAGADIAATIDKIIVSATKPMQGVVASLIAIATFLMGASRILVELRYVLNVIWGYILKDDEDEGLSIFKQVLQVILVRLFTILMLLVIGFCVLGLVVITTYFSIMNSWLAANTPDALQISRVLDPLATITVVTGFFYVIMYLLPAHRPPRHAVFFGALVAAILFNLGKTVMSIYIARAVSSSAYGAASSLVVLMLWIYISTCIFLYGVELASTIRLRKLDQEKEELSNQTTSRQVKRKKDKEERELIEKEAASESQEEEHTDNNMPSEEAPLNDAPQVEPTEKP